jgi:lactate dehydrogenase-like 2-hydroxyacid dehydrogenase
MKPELFLNFDLPPLEAALAADYIVHKRSALADLPDFLANHAAGVQVIVSLGSLALSVDMFNAMPKLKAIVLFSAGFEAVDLELCRQRNVALTTCSGANAVDVADMAFGLLLAMARNIPMADRFVRAGQWTATNRGGGLREGLAGSRLGILGLGAIGLEIAKRAGGFDMPVSYHNRRPREGVSYTFLPSVLELATKVDHLVIACPLSDETRNIVNRPVLQALGPQGILVNIARGGVVDEPALIDSLKAGEISGAGLDVFADEPHVPEALRTLDNVVMTPHHAGFTRRVFRNMGAMVADNVARAIAGNDLINRIV